MEEAAGPGTSQSLDGVWVASVADEELRRRFPEPGFDDGAWAPVAVPGHWRSAEAFATSDGPVLYRRRFEAPAPPEGTRTWLVMDGVFYHSDVWLDGAYLGDTEGYFFPHELEVTEALAARAEHVLAVEVGCERPAAAASRGRALMGIWDDPGSIDPGFNPGGIWAPVRLVASGPVRITALRLACVDADAERAVLELSCSLDSSERLVAGICTEARLCTAPGAAATSARRQPLALGPNRLRWQLEVPWPQLWWPAGLGPQPLYEVSVTVAAGGGTSDARRLRTGLRRVRMRDFQWRVNGEQVLLKGANLAPTKRDLASATAAEVRRDVELAARAGLNLLRARAHVGRPELYEAADEMGMLVWQDLPVYGRYRGGRRQAQRQAVKAVEVLGHHPCVIAWCGRSRGPGHRLSWLAPFVPGPNKSVVGPSIRRAFERADPSRPAIAQSGLPPHPAWGSSTHLYYGWRLGGGRDLRRLARVWPAAVRFVSELGAQSAPPSASFMRGERWPLLDWEGLAAHNCLDRAAFAARVPPEHYATFAEWSEATQAYQADLVRQQVEALRVLRSRPVGGFCVMALNDSQPAVSMSLLDHERRPKAAFGALEAACSPVLVVADWPFRVVAAQSHLSLDVHVVNDLAFDIGPASLEALLAWPGGGKRWAFAGRAPAGRCSFVGRLAAQLPSAVPAPEAKVSLVLRLEWGQPAEVVTSRYEALLAAPER